MLSTISGWLLGMLLGMRHALEPDHLTAVSTFVSDGASPRRGAMLGALWGAGHTLSLFAVGVVLAVLDARMPPRLADLFELGVAFMLVGLGIRSLRHAVRQAPKGPNRVHSHGGVHHEHAGVVAHVHLGGWTLARGPLVVGLVHGLAGSGALTALVLANLSSTASRLTYIAAFGLGSMGGMALLSGLAGWPLARLGRSPHASWALATLTGGLSVGLGIVWGYPLAWRCFQ